MDGLHTASLDVMRLTLAVRAALSGMVQTDRQPAERIAPLSAALDSDTEPAALWIEDVKPVSARRYAMVLRRFREVVGDPALSIVDHAMIWRVRDTIVAIPALASLPALIRSAPIPVQLQFRRDHPNHPAILPGVVTNHQMTTRHGRNTIPLDIYLGCSF